MKNKIVGILVVSLLIAAAVLPAVGTMNESTVVESDTYKSQFQLWRKHTFVNKWGREAHDLHIQYDKKINEGFVDPNEPATVDRAETSEGKVDVYGKFPKDSSVIVFAFPGDAKIEKYWWTTECGEKSEDIIVKYPKYPWKRYGYFKGSIGVGDEDCDLVNWIHVDQSNIDGEVQISKSQMIGGCELEFEGKVENTDEENGMVWLIVEIADEIFDLVLEIVPDVIPPTITIVSPDEGLYLGGNKVINLGQIIIIIGRVGIATNVIDEENGTGISHVEFFVDDELKYNDTDAFYEWIWDETAFFSHKLKVIAYDNAYNMASDEVEVWKFF